MRYPLNQLADIQPGYQPRERMRRDPQGTHRLIQIKDVAKDGRLDLDGMDIITPDGSPARYEVGAGDVLFIARGNRLAPVLVPAMPFRAVAISFFYILRPRTDLITPAFLAWSLAQPQAETHVRQHARGTGMPLLPRTGIESLLLDVPPLALQDRIMALVCLAHQEQALLTTIQQRRALLIAAACRRVAAQA